MTKAAKRLSTRQLNLDHRLSFLCLPYRCIFKAFKAIRITPKNSCRPYHLIIETWPPPPTLSNRILRRPSTAHHFAAFQTSQVPTLQTSTALSTAQPIDTSHFLIKSSLLSSPKKTCEQAFFSFFFLSNADRRKSMVWRSAMEQHWRTFTSPGYRLRIKKGLTAAGRVEKELNWPRVSMRWEQG